VALKDVTEGRRDVCWGEPSGGDLIEEGLKQVKISSINEGDASSRAAEVLGRVESAEPAADDDDVWRVCSIHT
jgi:hypothetical protein